MSDHRVIAWKRIPNRLPVWTGVTSWLLLDRLGAPSWVHGIWWTIYGIVFILTIVAVWQQQTVDPFIESVRSPEGF